MRRPCCLADRTCFRDQQGRTLESRPARSPSWPASSSRAPTGQARRLHAPTRVCRTVIVVPRVLVPQLGGSHVRQPSPPEPFLDGHVCAGKGACCLAQSRGRGGAAVGDEQGEALEQEVERHGAAPAAAGPERRGTPRPGPRRLPGARRTVPRPTLPGWRKRTGPQTRSSRRLPPATPLRH